MAFDAMWFHWATGITKVRIPVSPDATGTTAWAAVSAREAVDPGRVVDITGPG